MIFVGLLNPLLSIFGQLHPKKLYMVLRDHHTLLLLDSGGSGLFIVKKLTYASGMFPMQAQYQSAVCGAWVT